MAKRNRYSHLGTYEREQFRGGRKKGAVGLVRLDGGDVINKHGVEISDAEQRRLVSLVNSANRKRVGLLKKEEQMPFFSGGQRLPGETASGGFMGRESDFIFNRKSKSIHQFQSREQFDNYIKSLEKIVDRNYITNQVEQYKDNFIEALKNEGYNQEVIDKIESLSTQEFMQLVQTEEVAKFGFVYNEAEKENVVKGLTQSINRIKGE